MQFGVRFISKRGFPIRVTAAIGNWHIEEVRKAIRANLPIDAFYLSMRDVVKPRIFIEATPSVISECPHFSTTNIVQVTVTPGGLNGFLITKAFVYCDEDTGIPSYVEFDYDLDEAGILELWSKQGYPTAWIVKTTLNPRLLVVEKKVIESGVPSGYSIPG